MRWSVWIFERAKEEEEEIDFGAAAMYGEACG